jgi:hypothetical protein
MRPFTQRRANGELRFKPKPASPKPPKASGRSRITNNGLFLRGVDPRSSVARRFRDLARAYGAGLDDRDEAVRALVRDAAAAGIELERLQAAIARGDPVDRLEFGRLMNARRRHLEKLDAMRSRAQPPSTKHAKGLGGWTQPLWRHLHQMVWLRGKCGSAVMKGISPDRRSELLAEYDEREAAGEFASAVR